MPCFNHASFVAESVMSVLSQTYRNLELIVIDDCSSDNSRRIIERLALRDSRVTLLTHDRNEGLSRARNNGIRRAVGKFIAFCDSDDIWEPEKLSVQVALLDSNPAFDAVYCDAVIIDDEGSPIGRNFSDLFPPPTPASGCIFPALLLTNCINIQSVLMRDRCLQTVPSFTEQIDWVQDWWYWIQLSRHHLFLYSQLPLARYRVHRRSTNRIHQRAYAINRLRVFRRVLHRYSPLPAVTQANIAYEMAVDLSKLGKRRSARTLLKSAISLSFSDRGAVPRLCKALARLSISLTSGH